MKLQHLQDQLRVHIRSRIGRKELTGVSLARAAGFPQGHLSNFLNARRGLSLESMDRLLETLGIGVLDLVDDREIQQRAAVPVRSEKVETVAMVSPQNAALARFAPHQILETRSFNRSLLRRYKARFVEDRSDWVRFIVLNMKMKEVAFCAYPSSSIAVLVDRHYCSLQPYRRWQPNVYVVRILAGCAIGYVSVFDNYLVLRPRDPALEVRALPIDRGRTYAEHIIGRVCHVGLEI
jgi:transcriptional regulator with XRE-family HTH domain